MSHHSNALAFAQDPHTTNPLTNNFIYQSILKHQGKAEADAYLLRQIAEGNTDTPSRGAAPSSSVFIPNDTDFARLTWSNEIDQCNSSEDAQPFSIKTLIDTPEDARDSTERLISCTKDELSKGAYKTYHLLHQVASMEALRRDYHRGAGTVSFFCPVEAVAHARCCRRETIWRHVRELQALGYVDQRQHYTTHNGNTRVDGAVWAVKMRPHQDYHAKLRHDELKAQYRDLTTDIENGRTAYADAKNADVEKMQQSKELLGNYVFNTDIVTRWTYNPTTEQNPVIFDCCKTRAYALEGVLDVFSAAKPQRAQMVDYAAKAIAQKMQDTKGLGFYRKLLWNMLRSCDQQIHNSSIFQRLYNEVTRVTVDIREGFARNGAALLISRIKQWHDYQQIMDVAQTRVGAAPIAA